MKAKLKVSWDFNRTEIEEGTEVTIIKGMEADADGVLNAPYGMCYLCELDGVMSYVPAIYLTIIDWDNIDWEQRRYEIAKAAMQGVLSNPAFCNTSTNKDFPIKIAIYSANKLIEELKKTKNQ
jgi:hypothetical protein